MNKILVRAALGVFILVVLTSSAFPQWVQTNCPIGNSFSELYANQGNVFARTWKVDGGHLFLTEDNGTNWTEISSPESDILSLVILDDEILVGTWDGLYRSMLTEISWEKLTVTGIPDESPIWSIFRNW